MRDVILREIDYEKRTNKKFWQELSIQNDSVDLSFLDRYNAMHTDHSSQLSRYNMSNADLMAVSYKLNRLYFLEFQPTQSDVNCLRGAFKEIKSLNYVVFKYNRVVTDLDNLVECISCVSPAEVNVFQSVTTQSYGFTTSTPHTFSLNERQLQKHHIKLRAKCHEHCLWNTNVLVHLKVLNNPRLRKFLFTNLVRHYENLKKRKQKDFSKFLLYTSTNVFAVKKKEFYFHLRRCCSEISV